MVCPEDCAKQLAVIFQTINIFAFSAKANVALCAKGDIDDKKVLESLKSADVDYILSKSKNGLDMSLSRILDDEGIELSGGENQKLAISRAIYKNSPVIVLDEPTASLDPYAEHEIFGKLTDMSRGKTVIFISHRLSSCKICDKIAVFHKGEIVQQGTHDELINMRGAKYHEMYGSQAKYYT
jgi:ATP-binding cassette subfamily B protein/ATP-binding cassette subfamily C protein